MLGRPINQVATCDQVAWRWGDATATLHFGGSEPLARAFSQTPVVREVSITATAGEDGCRTVTRVELGDGTDGRHLVIGEGPPGLGRFPFGEILFELTWAGPACDPEPWTRCGAFELGGGEVSWGGALLTPCATSRVPAAIGGCGDAIDIPVSAGPLDCHARVRLGLTWPLWAPLCH